LRPKTARWSFPIILKADVTGSLEAIKHELNKISTSAWLYASSRKAWAPYPKVMSSTAQASGAMVIGFTVGTDSSARELAERAGVLIESFKIIYELKERIEELVKERAPRLSTEGSWARRRY
jgi:translation initiation factor IF-2